MKNARSSPGVLAAIIALLALAPVRALAAQAPERSPGLVSRIDHVMYPGGPELESLVEILRDKFELPVVFSGRAQTPPMPGTCFSFGNTCLEVVPLRADPDDPPPAAHIGSLALEAEIFTAVADSLKARGIDHFPPAPQTRWTTIGLRGFGGGMFFIEYRSGMSQRRQRFRKLLDERHGGPLGIVRMAEVSRTVRNLDEVRERWTRLLGAPVTGHAYLWPVGDGPAVRLVPVDDSLSNRIVVEVRSVSVAADALRRLAVPFVQANGAIEIDSDALLGLKVVLIGR